MTLDEQIRWATEKAKGAPSKWTPALVAIAASLRELRSCSQDFANVAKVATIKDTEPKETRLSKSEDGWHTEEPEPEA